MNSGGALAWRRSCLGWREERLHLAQDRSFVANREVGGARRVDRLEAHYLVHPVGIPSTLMRAYMRRLSGLSHLPRAWMTGPGAFAILAAVAFGGASTLP